MLCIAFLNKALYLHCLSPPNCNGTCIYWRLIYPIHVKLVIGVKGLGEHSLMQIETEISNKTVCHYQYLTVYIHGKTSTFIVPGTCINFSKYISKINFWVHKTTPPPPYVSYSQKIIKLFINHTNVKVPDACISLCNKLPLKFSNSLCWETLILNSSTVITALSKLLGSSVEAAILEKKYNEQRAIN